MIAADASTWIAFLQGESGGDTDLLDRALADKLVVMAPVVLTELLSDPKLDPSIGRTLAGLPLLEIRTGFWERAGGLWAVVLARRRKARLGDALIAQVCVDHRRSCPNNRLLQDRTTLLTSVESVSAGLPQHAKALAARSSRASQTLYIFNAPSGANASFAQDPRSCFTVMQNSSNLVS